MFYGDNPGQIFDHEEHAVLRVKDPDKMTFSTAHGVILAGAGYDEPTVTYQQYRSSRIRHSDIYYIHGGVPSEWKLDDIVRAKGRDVLYAYSRRDALALDYLMVVDGKRCMASWHVNDQHLHAYSDPEECEPLDADTHRHIDDCMHSKKVYRYNKITYTDTPRAVAEAAANLAQAAEEDDDDVEEEDDDDVDDDDPSI